MKHPLRQLTIIFLVASTLAFSQEKPNCDSAAGLVDGICLAGAGAGRDTGTGCKYDGTQQQMNACAVRDYKTADRSLNEMYKDVMAKLSRANQQLLRQEQRAWLKNRDPLCEEEAKDSKGGSIWPLDFYGCLKSVTESRTGELTKWRLIQ